MCLSPKARFEQTPHGSDRPISGTQLGGTRLHRETVLCALLLQFQLAVFSGLSIQNDTMSQALIKLIEFYVFYVVGKVRLFVCELMERTSAEQLFHPSLYSLCRK